MPATKIVYFLKLANLASLRRRDNLNLACVLGRCGSLILRKKCQEINLANMAPPKRTAKPSNMLAEKNLRATPPRIVNDKVARTNIWVRNPKYLPRKS